MTREDAILYFQELVNVIDVPPVHLRSAVAVEGWWKRTERMKGAHRMAISAMMEQEERSKGCASCDGGFGDNALEFAKLRYKFCPYCGRKLEE